MKKGLLKRSHAALEDEEKRGQPLCGKRGDKRRPLILMAARIRRTGNGGGVGWGGGGGGHAC
jgi:hypothetical protein